MTATAIKQKPTSRLGQVRGGTIKEPLRYLFYGSEGVGKSTLAAGAESPIMFDVEGGSSMIDVSRYSFRDDARGTIPLSLEEIYAGIEDLRRSPHDFKTLVIDALGAVEALIWGQICKSEKKDNIEELGFGKGYTLAVDKFRELAFALDRLRIERGMSIILLGHSTVKMFKNPLRDDYDRINLRMHGKSADFLRGWSDIVGYCAFEDGTAKADKNARFKGVSTGRRLVHLNRTAGYDAKSRVPLPSVIELEAGNSWAPFASAVSAGRDTSAKDLKSQIEVELVRIDSEDARAKATGFLKSARNDTSKLSVILNKLKEQPTATEDTE